MIGVSAEYFREIFIDISPISNLSNLKEFHARQTNIRDISALRNLTSLEVVDISACFFLHDVSALSGLYRLKKLYMAGNSLTGGLNFISLLGELEYVDLRFCSSINPEILELLAMLVPPNCVFLY